MTDRSYVDAAGNFRGERRPRITQQQWPHTLTLTREDEFSFLGLGPTQCGAPTPTGYKQLRYKLQVKCSGSSLDPRGFLFDQLKLTEQLADFAARHPRLSCERLVQEMADFVLVSLARENPALQVRHMKLQLAPEPFSASMTFETE